MQLKGRDRITGPQLGYGLDYALKIEARSFHVKTSPVPSALTSRSFATGMKLKVRLVNYPFGRSSCRGEAL